MAARAESLKQAGPRALLTYLARRHEVSRLDDCPLPELYRHLKTGNATVTHGQFHDLLRRLHDDGKIYLHPWTGPLYELPEPALCPACGARSCLLRQSAGVGRARERPLIVFH